MPTPERRCPRFQTPRIDRDPGHKRGITRDTLGAASEGSEILVLLVGVALS